MGEWFTALVLDVLRGWIGSSEGGDLKRMTKEEIASYHDMQDRHSKEEQAFLRRIFRE
jgi:hypothetical protein